MKISTALKALAGAAVVMLPLTASAESTFSTGAAALTSTAHVDFQVTIPKILYLRVGTGSAYPTTLSSIGTTDLVTFSPTAAVVGNGTAVVGAGCEGRGDDPDLGRDLGCELPRLRRAQAVESGAPSWS